MASFSFALNETPAVCSPSRSVVSSISILLSCTFKGFNFVLLLKKIVDII